MVSGITVLIGWSLLLTPFVGSAVRTTVGSIDAHGPHSGPYVCALQSILGQQPIRNELALQVSQLVRQLDSPQLASRTIAEKRLVQLGPRILQLLPAEADVTSPQTRLTLQKVRNALEHQAALDSLAASRVTLRGEFFPTELVDEIGKQTGNRVELARDFSIEAPYVTVDLQQVPFWQALQQLEQQQVWRITTPAQRPLIELAIPTPEPPPAAAFQGPFRLQLRQASLRPLLSPAERDQPRQQLLRLDLEIAVEPRLRGLFLLWKMSDCTLVLKDGGEMLPPHNPAAAFDLPLGEGGRSVRCQLDFLVPADWKQAAIPPLVLTTNMQLEIAAHEELIRFSPLLKSVGETQRRGGMTATVRDVLSEPNAATEKSASPTQHVSARLLIAYDEGGPAFESHRTWLLHNQVQLRHDKQSWTPDSWETDLQGGGLISVTYHFHKVPADVGDLTLDYLAPTIVLPVPFKIQLPIASPPVTPATDR